MTSQLFRFIHAADLHLERPINGLSECPDYLEERVLQAPFQAARKLFQLAIHEKVDFILLSGDVIAPEMTGPWGLLFLIDEFKKLHTEGIQVYWAGGKVDSPDELPAGFVFPPNVFFFPVGQVKEYINERAGMPLARIIGTSLGKQSINLRPKDLEFDSENLYTIALFYGKVTPEQVRNDGVLYWALGGEHKREFVSRAPAIIHYPGVTLARNPSDRGEYGASLVEVNEFGQTKVNLIKLSPIRWVTERLILRDDMIEDEIIAEMRGRLKSLRESQGDVLLFVSWQLDVKGDTLQELRYGNLTHSILRELRADFAKEEPIAYSLNIKPILPDVQSNDTYEHQTIMGDYLRLIHYYQENDREKLDLTHFLSEELQEYLLICDRYEQHRKEALRSAVTAEGTPTEELLAPEVDIRAFRPEVPALLELLLAKEFDSKTSDKAVPGDPEEEKRRSKKMKLRATALRESGMLGMELLAAEEPALVKKQSAPRQNPSIVHERRNLAQTAEKSERKESHS